MGEKVRRPGLTNFSPPTAAFRDTTEPIWPGEMNGNAGGKSQLWLGGTIKSQAGTFEPGVLLWVSCRLQLSF